MSRARSESENSGWFVLWAQKPINLRTIVVAHLVNPPRPHSVLPMTLVTKELYKSHSRIWVASGFVVGPRCDYMLQEMGEESRE